MTFDKVIIKNGFESVAEFHKLVAAADLTGADKIRAFMAWRDNDGTKAGLLALSEKQGGK